MSKRLCFISAVALLCACSHVPSDVSDYLWSVRMENLANPDSVINLSYKDFTCEAVSRDVYRFTSADAEVLFKWTAGRDVLEVTPTLTNNKEGWVITSISGPFLPVETRLEEHKLLLPAGYGQKFVKTPCDSPEFTKGGTTEFAWTWHKSEKYYDISKNGALPTFPNKTMTMQWCAFAGADDGIYLASHDPAGTFKNFIVRYYPEEDLYRFGLRCHHVLHAGESSVMPTTTMRMYRGDWHAAADMYRSWFESVKTYAPQPDWLKQSTGWILTILKQQNDEIIWTYKDLRGCLAEAAVDRGIDVIGLFGWTAGGHDRWYPEYDVCPKMGGEEELRTSLASIREKGMHSIIYVNGQLQDMDGTKHWWEETGKDITVRKKDGSLDFQIWHKYSDAPARRHGRPCHSTEIWREKLLELAKMAEGLGADGIIYDQLAAYGPMFCYSPDHGHSVPAIVYEQDRQDNLDYVRSEMEKINPSFIVMTEGTLDWELSAIDCFHGCTYGVSDPKLGYQDALIAGDKPFVSFPEMLKYTLPRIECSARNPSPVASRMFLNYCTEYGFKHEVEIRYAADRKYLLEDHIPSLEEYGTVIHKPNIKLMQTLDATEMRVYSKQVQDLRRKYSDCLLKGTFRDDVGLSLSCDNPYVMAKAFDSKDGGRAAVVVWNYSDEASAQYSVTLNGRKPVTLDAPGYPSAQPCKASGESLEPQSIQVLVFE